MLLDDGCYHLIARGNNRLFVFDVPGGFSAFLEIIKKSKEKFKWQLFHYCLLSNHFHLLGKIEEGETLPKLMQYLLFEYSRWYRKKISYIGHVWQGRYKSELILQEGYFLECGRYIERNPLRAGMVENIEDYPWSSYCHYAHGKIDSLVDNDPYYEQLGENCAVRTVTYRDYVCLERPYEKIVEKALLQTYF